MQRVGHYSRNKDAVSISRFSMYSVRVSRLNWTRVIETHRSRVLINDLQILDLEKRCCTSVSAVVQNNPTQLQLLADVDTRPHARVEQSRDIEHLLPVGPGVPLLPSICRSMIKFKGSPTSPPAYCVVTSVPSR